MNDATAVLLCCCLLTSAWIAFAADCGTPNTCMVESSCTLQRRTNDTCLTAGETCCVPAPTPKPTTHAPTPAPTAPPTPSPTPAPTPMPTPKNCAFGSTEVSGACSEASVCRGLNGSFVGDSTCGSQGCCTIGACVWSEWSVCDCLDVIESKRTRSRREIALPNGWPPIPNCLPMVESNVCRQCLKGNSTDTAAEPTPAFFDNDALLAAAQMDASTFEALFIAFLVLLLLTWVALAVFCFYQRRAAESRVVALPEPLEHRPTDLSQYAEAPTAPVHTGTYAAASLHSRGSGSTPYGEAPRSSTGQYLPVGSQSSGEENYVDVPSPQFTQAMLAKQPSQTNIVTTYVPVPRGKAGTTAAAAAAAAARRPTGGAALPAPIATMHDNNNNAYV